MYSVEVYLRCPSSPVELTLLSVEKKCLVPRSNLIGGTAGEICQGKQMTQKKVKGTVVWLHSVK